MPEPPRHSRGPAPWRWPLVLWLLAAGCADPGPPPPDVLVAVLDTVRADRTSLHGYVKATSIQLEALAAAGVVFEDVTSSGAWTWPSHASLFTGEPPWVHGAHLVADGPGDDRARHGMTVGSLRPDLPTLAERFAGAGYRTVALVANDWVGPELGLLRGFAVAELFGSDAAVVEAAAAEIRNPRDAPLFLFVNLLSAHSPYREGPGPWSLGRPDLLDPATAPAWVRPYLAQDAPPGVHLLQTPPDHAFDGVTRFLAGDLKIPPEGFEMLGRLYDAGVRAADFGFGRVLETWLAEHPDVGVAVATSDHGEALGERGLLDHRGAVYPELLRVPLVVAAPGRLPAGVRVATPVQLEDLYPTLLDLAGIAVSPPGSLVPVVGGSAREGPILATAWPNPKWAHHAGGRFREVWRLYRVGRYGLVFSDAGDVELYDVEADPGMRVDLAAQQPQRVAALRKAARAQFAPAPEAAGAPLAIPEETLQRLRHLGYVDE